MYINREGIRLHKMEHRRHPEDLEVAVMSSPWGVLNLGDLRIENRLRMVAEVHRAQCLLQQDVVATRSLSLGRAVRLSTAAGDPRTKQFVFEGSQAEEHF